MDRKQTVEELQFLVKQKERSLQTISKSPLFNALSADNLKTEIRVYKQAVKHLESPGDVIRCGECRKQATKECPLTIVGINSIVITGPVNDFYCGAAERESGQALDWSDSD